MGVTSDCGNSGIASNQCPSPKRASSHDDDYHTDQPHHASSDRATYNTPIGPSSLPAPALSRKLDLPTRHVRSSTPKLLPALSKDAAELIAEDHMLVLQRFF